MIAVPKNVFTITDKVAILLSVPVGIAAIVVDAMCEDEIRFSSCTQEEFNQCARECYARMRGEGNDC